MTKDEALKLAKVCIQASLEYKRGNATAVEAVEDIDTMLAQLERPWAGLDHDELIERANQEECASVFSRGAIWGAARLREKNT